MAEPSLRSVWRKPSHFLAFGFGTGTMPFMPGTWGTLIAIPIYFAFSELSLPLYASIVIVMAVFGIWLCDTTSKALGVDDYPGIVWDEITGYLITMFAAPKGWLWILTGFVLFRIFDIWKPWPIRNLEKRVPGGLGIMLDDWIAGFYAAIILQSVAWFVAPLMIE